MTSSKPNADDVISEQWLQLLVIIDQYNNTETTIENSYFLNVNNHSETEYKKTKWPFFHCVSLATSYNSD